MIDKASLASADIGAFEMTDDEIGQYVHAFLSLDVKSGKRNHDPVDDFNRLLCIAVEMPGVKNLPGHFDTERTSDLAPKHTIHKRYARGAAMIRFVGDYLHTVNPSISAQDWMRLYHAILVERHGTTRVYIRKRPALGPREDARRLSFKQLQTKYPHLSRSRLYRLLQDAHRKK